MNALEIVGAVLVLSVGFFTAVIVVEIGIEELRLAISRRMRNRQK